MPDPAAALRGFAPAEFEARTARAQTLMAEAGFDALFVTTPQNVRYFTGFDSQFWESPTRPWFLVVPGEGKPVAVIPEIGGPGMLATWADDVRTWPSPRPADDGISLLAAALGESPRRHGRIGAELGREMSLRMPVADLEALREALGNTRVENASPLLWALRAVKSPGEIDRIRHICQITSDAFEALPAAISPGMSEREACRLMRLDLLARGADNSPYLMGSSGPGGYDNIIMGPTDRVMQEGDLFIIDTGTTFDGYFCDFDRNFAIGQPDDATRRAHEAVWQSTEAGYAAARPGATTEDVWRAMMTVLEAAGSLGNNVGRLGHGLGLQLTEPPSNMPGDTTVIEPGMVLTLEPGMAFAPGKMIVHEENIAITGDKPEWLTRRAPRELPISC